jgi:hypothetical protein
VDLRGRSLLQKTVGVGHEAAAYLSQSFYKKIRVLGPEFDYHPLRQQNLLKTDGYKITRFHGDPIVTMRTLIMYRKVAQAKMAIYN